VYVYVKYILNHRNSMIVLKNDKGLVFCISRWRGMLFGPCFKFGPYWQKCFWMKIKL